LENAVLRERVIQAEKELQRFETTEDIIMNGTLDWYMKTVCNQIGSVVPDHPRVKAFMQAMDLLKIDPKPATEPIING
jgi:hypothetical protein